MGKVRKMQGEIDVVRKAMINNIEKVLERSERIELLVEKADHLRDSAYQFNTDATSLRRHMWWKNMKMNLTICAVLCIIIFLIVWISCGWSFEKCGAKTDNNNST